MADGAMGWGLMVMAAFVVGALGLMPLGIVGLIPTLRRSIATWTIALAIASYTFIWLSVQMRVVTGRDGTSDGVFALGLLLAVAPIFLLGHPEFAKTRWWRLIAFVPVVVLFPRGLAMMAFRSRSERLLLAVNRGDNVELTRLLRQGADSDCFDVGRCAIDVAVDRRDWKAVETLIRYGAVNVEYHQPEDIDSDRPTTSAAKKMIHLGKPELAKRLLANRN